VQRLAMAQPAVSKHLRILRDAGLVAVRADGPRRLYRLQPEPLLELDEWLEPYRQMWRTSLDRLERHLAEGPPPPRRKPS
jgi:DNA-binding transcriptional ArsR family regulator